MTKMPLFETRHYKAIAALLSDLPTVDRRNIGGLFVCMLTKDNPKFDANKFWEALRLGS